MKKKTFIISLLILGCTKLWAQNYHAVQGSSYAGVLGAANNPASIVNAPFPWDVNLLSFQYKNATNAITVFKYSLLSTAVNSEYRIESGNFSRFAIGNFNMHILNARIALNRRHAVAFGLNIRGYGKIKTGKYNYIDTLQNLRDYLKVNITNPAQSANTTTSAWLEIFGTYAGTVWDREADRLNAGATLKLNRGISGAFASLQNGLSDVAIVNGRQTYLAKSANLRYGYPASHDHWSSSKTTSQNIQDILKESDRSISLDLGFEYLKKSETISNFDDDDDYHDYDWKIGMALLDLGCNSYQYSIESRAIDNPKQNITAEMIERKFNSLESIRDFNDSIATIASAVKILTGQYIIINPARFVMNYDRYVYGNFYVNGEMSVNLAALAGQEKLSVAEFNLLTLTPRWETRRFGVYLPIQYSLEGQFWIGGAFKAGPLLIGVHNWNNVFAKDKIQNGGGYLAFVIRPGKLTGLRRDKRNDCPAY